MSYPYDNLPVHCGDCHTKILLMEPNLRRDHQKKIGDAVSNAILTHVCPAKKVTV
jgi:hypothetical protein